MKRSYLDANASLRQFNRSLKRLAGAFVTLISLLPVTAAADPAFSVEPTQSCVAAGEASSPSLSNHGVLDCVGLAAQACMMTPGGDTTVGMIECLSAEVDYWQSRLDVAYATRLEIVRQQDAEMLSIRATHLSLEATLTDMHARWIAFRDAACLHEQAQWMGGTGSGPATAACHMHETARQALKLEGWWSQ